MKEIIEKWGKYADMIYQDVLDRDWNLEDWLNKDEDGLYEENEYFEGEEDFAKLVKLSIELKEKLKGKFYSVDNEQMLQLSDNHTIWELNPKKDIDMETYWMLARDKFNAFEQETGVELFGEGRSSRHICVHNTLENAYRYDELCRVQKRLEQELIEEINRDDF